MSCKARIRGLFHTSMRYARHLSNPVHGKHTVLPIKNYCSVEIAKEDIFSRIMSHFPKNNLQMAFAYGSGVFRQHGQSDQQVSSNMLDFIFVVDDALNWHKKNMKLNRNHYSFLKYFGNRFIVRMQEKHGARVYFNTKIQCEGREIKYGVITTSNLITDLLDWETLYVSGRMHKPIRIIIEPTNTELLSAMHINLQNALHTALLLLPESFTEEELYMKITALSYQGDFRMIVGENKNKISDIVKPNVKFFRQLYGHILQKEEHINWNMAQGLLEQYPNQTQQFHHLNLLPKQLQLQLLEPFSDTGKFPDIEDVLRKLAFDSHCSDYVEESLFKIVRNSSYSQSVKSFFTAGPIKGGKYIYKKLQKMKASQKKITVS